MPLARLLRGRAIAPVDLPRRSPSNSRLRPTVHCFAASGRSKALRSLEMSAESGISPRQPGKLGTNYPWLLQFSRDPSQPSIAAERTHLAAYARPG
jgi:hypothetical protein